MFNMFKFRMKNIFIFLSTSLYFVAISDFYFRITDILLKYVQILLFKCKNSFKLEIDFN